MVEANQTGPPAGDSRRRLGWALLLTGGFMVAEAAGGLVSGSLALLADAGHMLADAAALALAWLAARLSARPADARRTYGYHRVQVLAAFLNGLTLLAITGWIVFEAVRRIVRPVEVMGGLMLAVAGLGLLVNLAVLLILRGGDRANLNLRGALLHVLGDLLGSLAAMTAAGVILQTGWRPIDPLLSILVALLILHSAWYLVRRSGHILVEGAPEDLDLAGLEAALVAAVPEVRQVHHVHAWSLTPQQPLLTLHALIDDRADDEAVLRRMQAFLAQRFGLDHVTIQLERSGCADQEGRCQL